MIREDNGLIGTDWQVVDTTEPDSFAMASGVRPRRMLLWLREYDGRGKFYYDNIFDQIYFECDEDREMFMLRWL